MGWGGGVKETKRIGENENKNRSGGKIKGKKAKGLREGGKKIGGGENPKGLMKERAKKLEKEKKKDSEGGK